jgi:hypothetical protein
VREPSRTAFWFWHQLREIRKLCESRASTLEQVGPRGQDVSGKLNGLTKCNYRFLIELTCTRSRQDDQKCKQKRNGGKRLDSKSVLHNSSFF